MRNDGFSTSVSARALIRLEAVEGSAAQPGTRPQRISCTTRCEPGAAPDPVKFRDADALEFEKARGSLKFGDQTSLVVDARASIGFVAWAEPTAAVKTRSA